MKQNQHVRNHLELTTGCLMARRSQWAYLAEDVPEGALLIVVPESIPKARTLLMKVAECFARRGGEAVVRFRA